MVQERAEGRQYRQGQGAAEQLLQGQGREPFRAAEE